MTGHAEIAGGGFAGLVAAVALARRGWSVRVHERSDALRKPARFAEALQACESDARGRLGFETHEYPQAERLRVDLQRHSEQEQTVTGRQHQVRKEVAQLEAQRIAAQAQLNKAHRALHQLKVATSEGVPHLHAR